MKGKVLRENKDTKTYLLLDNFMTACMEDDGVHGREHIYRVLYNGLEIAKTEENVDYNVLIAACLLHDIGRKEEKENLGLPHALVGGDKAYDFLVKHGFAKDYAERVKHCIQNHSKKRENMELSLEAKILFDADKIDLTGAIGLARTLMYQGSFSEPIYIRCPDGRISDGEKDTEPSFFQEYKCRLEKIPSWLYTRKAREIAAKRQEIAAEFYKSLYQEVSEACIMGEKDVVQMLLSEKVL